MVTSEMKARLAGVQSQVNQSYPRVSATDGARDSTKGQCGEKLPTLVRTVESDLEIARAVPLRPLPELCARFGIPAEALIPYGHTRAKLRIDARPESPRKERARYVLVTAITPTPAGEGKTVNTIGLSLALNRIGQKAVCTIRQPSMGPVFGIKGGAAGGGKSQVVPMEDFNLHLTGDFHAVAAANNLLAAAIDTSILLDNPLGIDPERVTWRRVVDMNDRA